MNQMGHFGDKCWEKNSEMVFFSYVCVLPLSLAHLVYSVSLITRGKEYWNDFGKTR